MTVRKNTRQGDGGRLQRRGPRAGKPRTAPGIKSPDARRGGREWQPFRDRLERLVRAARSRAQFAKACGVSPTMLNSWLFGRALPGAIHLQNVARAGRVTLDWLVDGVDHAGRPSEEPVYRGEVLSGGDLETGLAARVSRELGGQSALPIASTEFVFDGAALVKGAVDIARADLSEWGDWYKKDFRPALDDLQNSIDLFTALTAAIPTRTLALRGVEGAFAAIDPELDVSDSPGLVGGPRGGRTVRSPMAALGTFQIAARKLHRPRYAHPDRSAPTFATTPDEASYAVLVQQAEELAVKWALLTEATRERLETARSDAK